jgi:2-dehydro-3-deoxygalactonokinase
MKPRSKTLLAVDWGSSALRAALLDGQGQVLQTRQFELGILKVAPGQFEAVFEQCLGDWMAEHQPLCLISGMAGSRQGWQEAPYCPCPAGFEALGRHLLWIKPQVALVPGLHCVRQTAASAPWAGQDDVMRGEEVQVFGALALTGLQEAHLILPGTHSKWVAVRQGKIHHFQTFMTGEVFAVLSQHSILARTMVADAAFNEAAFVHAVQLAQEGPGVLAHVFGTRTSALFDRLPGEHLGSHLSGLLIGEELRAMRHSTGPLLLVGSALLTARYELALRTLGRQATALNQEATWAGHLALARGLDASTQGSARSVH